MKPATVPRQRPPDAKLLAIDCSGYLFHLERSSLVDHLRPGDLLVANDAATVPASLHGIHRRTGAAIEIRLAGRRSLDLDDVRELSAIAFGAGDHRVRTEDRPPPPALEVGDVLVLGPLEAAVISVLGHPRLVLLRFSATPDEFWAGIAQHGAPIQYAHIEPPLELWDTWTRVAYLPVAFEPPSAGFLIDWQLLDALEAHEIEFATLTHAAGISSTGDQALDRRLPFDEPYAIPEGTAQAIARTKARGGRVVALGTTVTRALEHAARLDGVVRPGPGLATQRIGPGTRIRVVDVIVTGAHEPGDSHYQLLRAFAGDAVLERASAELERGAYRSHEYGDSLLVERR